MARSEAVNLFPTSLLLEEREDPLSEKEFKALKNISWNEQYSNLISNDDDILEKREFSSIKKFILDSLNKYMREVIKCADELVITSSWVNINRKGMYHVRHCHPNSVLSGVFYFTDSQTPLYVYDPNSSSKTWDYDIQEFHGANSDQWAFPPVKNTCIIFPSSLDHSVPIHNDNKDRISLSFNSFFKN